MADSKASHVPLKRPLFFALLAIAALLGGDYFNLHAKAKSDIAPYWGSIRDDKAYMRTGPSDSYPIKWVYKRKNLPVKVIGKEAIWRKIEDVDGDQGWMHVKLLSSNRTAIITGEAPQPLRDSPDVGARINWRAQPGVVGKISECAGNWCLFDVAGQIGYIRRDAIWGDEPLAGQKNQS